jgi:translation initiation factor IF-3
LLHFVASMVAPAQRLVQTISSSGRLSINKLFRPSNGSSNVRTLLIHGNVRDQQRRPFFHVWFPTTTSSKLPMCDESVSRLDVRSTQMHILPSNCESASYSLSSSYQIEATRRFSSSVRQPKQKQPKQQARPVLSNEELIARLVRNANGASPDAINVRLVIDEGPNNPSTVQVTTLREAVQLSLDRNADLIGSSLDNDPPVVRLADMYKLQYRAEQAQKKQHQQATTSTKREKKSFRFKAGIENHDLDRKVAQLTGHLQKGNDCEYTVFSRARTLRQNENAGIELVDRIQALIEDHGVLKRAPETNETKSFYRVQLAPKKYR